MLLMSAVGGQRGDLATCIKGISLYTEIDHLLFRFFGYPSTTLDMLSIKFTELDF